MQEQREKYVSMYISFYIFVVICIPKHAFSSNIFLIMEKEHV